MMWSMNRSLRSIGTGYSSTNSMVSRNVCFNGFASQKLNPKIVHKQIKIINDECSAMLRMLNRSSSKLLSNDYICRNFHTTTHLFENNSGEQESKKDDKSDKKSTKNESDQTKPPPKKKPTNKKKSNNNESNMAIAIFKGLLWTSFVYSCAVLLSLVMRGGDTPEAHDNREISWNEFVHHMLIAGEVREIIVVPDFDKVTIRLHNDAIVKGRRVRNPIFYMTIPDAVKFEQKIRDVERKLGIKDGVSIKYDRQTAEISKLIVRLALIVLLIWILSNIKFKMGGMGMDSLMGKAKFTLINPLEGGKGVYFKDVAGMQEAKQEVIEFVDYLKHPEKYQRLGAKVPKGAILLGPPGCGKTLLAKAVATEAKVPFLTMNGSEFIEMIGGLGAARVRDLFKAARKRAPCIIYIDEIDAIGRQRSGTSGGQMSSGESEQTLNQLLVEMDGIATKKGVLMLASTNRADVLDKALMRPGRFDRHILIDLPNLQERKEIFEKHLSGITLDQPPSFFSARLATLTPGFSGADIANVVNEAALHAARTCQKKVTSADFEYAVERTVGGAEKRTHAMSKDERRIVAYHESGHALIGWIRPTADVLQKVTIVPRTSLALGFAQYTPSEQKLFSKEQLIDKMCMILGGRAAENITFSRITTGAQNDLDKVTKMAYAMVSKYGMNERIGPMYVPDENEENYTGEKPYSHVLGNIVDIESRKLVQTTYLMAEETLRTNRDKLIKLAEALLEKETLNYDEVVALIGPPTHEAAKRKIDPIEFENSIKNISTDAPTVP